VALALLACGDDDRAPMSEVDAGMDARQALPDAGPAPVCGAQQCGSPLVGEHCCTAGADVERGAADRSDRCGADLSAIIDALAGTCVELRRPGTLDDQCPPRAVGSALEPGCCLADGTCGTVNAAADLGCQRVIGSDAAPIACGANGGDGGQPDAH
jgi:hypothetical protein